MPRKYKKYTKMVKKSKALTKETVKRMIVGQLEKKYWDIGGNYQIDTNGTVVALTNIPQGSDDQSRDGEQIRLIKSSLRIVVKNGDNQNFLRFIIFRWLDNTNLALPTIPQVLQGSASVGAGILSDYNFDNKRAGQFQVLYDKVFTVATGGPSIVFKKDKSYYPTIPINFTDINGQNHGTGKLYLLMLSDSNAVAHPTVDMFHRTVFHDA